MSIKQNGGVFGRNPTFNDVTIEGDLIINGEVFTGLDFQGSWNASTNSPALASSVGTNGEFYIVSVAGTTDLNGITNWGIGDWAIFNGTAWQRVEGGADGNFNDLTAHSLVLNRLSTDGILAEFQKDGTAVGSIGTDSGDLTIYGTVAGHTGFRFGNGEVYPTNNGGSLSDNTASLGSTSVRFKDLYLSGGVYLGGTGAANLLDDYEEGTWTPALTVASGTAPTLSTTTAGFYTKVGRLVTITGYIEIVSISGTVSGTINIGALPFTALVSAGALPVGAIAKNGVTFARTDTANITLYNASYAGFLTSNNGVGWNWEAFSIFSAGNALRFTLSYQTT